jgi:hypothetical protein
MCRSSIQGVPTKSKTFYVFNDGVDQREDWLRAGRSGDQISVGARFFAHVQNGPEAQPASCTMGTGSFPGGKLPGRGADHPPPSSAEVKKE